MVKDSHQSAIVCGIAHAAIGVLLRGKNCLRRAILTHDPRGCVDHYRSTPNQSERFVSEMSESAVKKVISVNGLTDDEIGIVKEATAR